MTKLEQVARAIQASDFEDGGIPWEQINPGGQSDYRRYARAAVEALRDPGENAKHAAGAVWSSGIDAILSEQPK